MIFILSAIVVVSACLYWIREPECRIPAGGTYWSFELAKTLPEQTR